MTSASNTIMLISVTDQQIAEQAVNVDPDFTITPNTAHIIVSHLAACELEPNGLMDCIEKAAKDIMSKAMPDHAFDSARLQAYAQPLRGHISPGMPHIGLAAMQPPHVWTAFLTEPSEEDDSIVMLVNTPKPVKE